MSLSCFVSGQSILNLIVAMATSSTNPRIVDAAHGSTARPELLPHNYAHCDDCCSYCDTASRVLPLPSMLTA